MPGFGNPDVLSPFAWGFPLVDLVIVGSIALDSVRTPFGEVSRALGGSATYAAYAASFFAKPGIVGVVGSDFPNGHLEMLRKRGIDLSGLERRKDEKTFFWEGNYDFDMNLAHTVKTELNAFAKFNPELPDSYRKAEFLFLGNISPELQLAVLRQMKKRPKLVLADTMNFWIERNKDKVLKVVKEVDIALMNDAEARELFKTHNLVKAARRILRLDSEFAIIKKGEHGATLFTDSTFFSAPGYPLEDVIDPTGAGDCFAGAFLGYLSKTRSLTERNIRKAVVYASAVASFNAEGFSLNRLRQITRRDIEKRFREFRKISEF